jgi:hypothetical protein
MDLLIRFLAGILFAAVVVWLLGGVAGLPGIIVGILAFLVFLAIVLYGEATLDRLRRPR